MPTIQVFEHERLTTHKDYLGRCITNGQLEKLCGFNDRNDNKYFTVIRNGVKFNSYVGVIQIGNLVIEILPKADKIELTKENEKQRTDKWRRVLLKMLAISGNINIESVSEALLRKRATLLDLYLEMYLKEVSQILRRGLVKKYRKETSNVNALKGRILFAKNIQKNLIHQERFHTTHQRYDYEHLINQILIKGLRVLGKISGNEAIISKVNQLYFAFPEIHEINIDQAAFDKVNLNRKTESYSEALKIARMLILNYSPDISKGQDDMLALLFDMNMLWEKYIYKKLKQGENGCYTVSYQDRAHFWESREIRPDLVIRQGGDTIIMDTKWRLAEPNKPTDDELKQMFAYNLYWGAKKCVLLYPKTVQKYDGKFGKFHKGHEEGHFCKVAFVNVLNSDGELNLGVAEEVLEKIN